MTVKFNRPLLAALVGLTLISGETAWSQTETAGQGRVFEPAYFTQYAPRTALDMVSRVPGFQLDSGDSKRGLGQGGANVLLNGQRLTGKSGDPFNQLGRISAENVLRIEIQDGASLNIPGLSGQVANVVTKKATKMTGTYEWRPEWREGLQANLLPFSVTVSGEKGNLSYTAEIKNGAFRNGHGGPELRTDRFGNLFEVRNDVGVYNGDNPGGSLNLTWKPKEDHVGNLNFEYNQFNFNETTRSDRDSVTNPGALTGTDFNTLFTFAEDEWNAKVDGDYEFPFWDGKLKLIGYYREEHSPTEARFLAVGDTGAVDNSLFARVADEGEAITRTEYSWSKAEGRDWQLGVEGVYNFLDVDSIFADFLSDPDPIDLGNTRVEEYRGEATLTHSRALSPKWDVQISAGAEYSELEGINTDAGGMASGNSRSFFRPKGFVSATYKPDDSLQIRTKLEREVGQLNFFDFVSRVDLIDNIDSTGNLDLVPSQSWNAELEFDKQFKGGHTFKARFYGERISDLVDRIPIGMDGDAVGNIDSAERYGVDFDATIKGDPFGLKGMELNLELDGRDSSVDDPVEGFSRRLNGDKQYYWSVQFRHDIPNTDWAWGFFSDEFRQAPVYRLNTINQFRFEGPWAHAFIEHKDVFGLKVNASLRNLFDASDDFNRIVYTTRRDVGEVERIQAQARDFGFFFRLNISGTF